MTVDNGSTIQASVRFTSPQGQDHVNVYHFVFGGTSMSDEAFFDAVDLIMTTLYNNLEIILHVNAVPLDLKVDEVTFDQFQGWQVTRAIGYGAWGAGVAGTQNGDMMPPGVAALIKLGTGFGRHIGKKFLGMMSEGQSDASGAPSAGTMGIIAGAFAGLLGTLVPGVGSTLVTVVLDRLEGVPRAVTEIIVRGIWSYQRRRREGVGS